MKVKRALYRSGIVICSAGLLLSGIMLVRQWAEYRSAESSYEAWEKEAAAAGETAGRESGETPEIDWKKLQAVNPETKGWLFSRGTELSYPVVQGADNEYYLNHLFDGTENSSGCLFIDSGWEEGKHRNCVIYGHHMKNGTMFALLENYQQQEYFEIVKQLAKKYPQITLSEEELCLKANQWELSHGGISGRTATQFIANLAGSVLQDEVD
mgnify:CR=1 FL=1